MIVSGNPSRSGPQQEARLLKNRDARCRPIGRLSVNSLERQNSQVAGMPDRIG